MRSTAAPYTESRLTRSVANERVGFPVVEQNQIPSEIKRIEKWENFRAAYKTLRAAQLRRA